MPKIAESDSTITDPNTGLEHKVFAGQPIPGHLLSDDEREEYEVIGTSTTQPQGVIADSDDEREDPNTGLTHKIVAGQPIPPNLQTDAEKGESENAEAEEAEPEEEPEPEAPAPLRTRRNKVQRQPDRER